MEKVELLLLLLMLALSLRVGRGGGGPFVRKLKARCSTEERDALINFKRSISDPYRFLSNWDIDDNCCEWVGVDCNNTTGNVIKIDLSRRTFVLNEYLGFDESDDYHRLVILFGMSFEITVAYHEDWAFYARSFDPSLFLLKYLQYLCLNAINFNNASIPQSISSLTNLYHLDLSYTALHGIIPPHLGNLTNLKFLDLSGNYLVASNLLWMSRLSSLQYLDMSNVDLTHAINWLHEINILRSLFSLTLQSCNLQTLSNLLPYSNSSSTIQELDISYNQFPNSTIPFWLCNMTNLVYLDLSNNLIDGCIPQWIKNMSNLYVLVLANNRLSGSIPYGLGQLSKLSRLDLSHNQLKDSLSDVHFVNLSQLVEINLSNNQLNFNMMSPNWVPPFQVLLIFLSSCQLGPNFPSWFKTQKFLGVLELSNCGISDIIPSWFLKKISQLYYLNMSHNAIRGEFPMSLNIKPALIDLRSNLLEGYLPQCTGDVNIALFSNNSFSKGIERYLNANMSSLKLLDLSHNHLYGKIPESICQMPSIIILHLSHNNLSGEIPKCTRNVSFIMKLKFIGLSNNNISGLIPQWVGNLPMLLSLYLSNNSFYGEIPFFKNCSKLISLYLGQNKLVGTIPSWIGETLLSLKILCLRSNKFYGSIPSNLFKLKRLQILYLADNLLSGSLPKSLKFLHAMTIQNKMLESLIPNNSVDIVGPLFYGILNNNDYHEIIHNNNYNYPGLISEINSLDSLIIDTYGGYREVTNILGLEIIMDLSCNNLTGEVPTELMSLIALRGLNLSQNQFTGHIPFNIDAMQSLELLDLSRNYFSGEIPESITKLDKLSYLNLSNNQLSGRIPTGTQLDTFDESSYFGNPKLCGKPLIKTCEDDEHDIYNGGSNSQDDDDDDDDAFGLFFGMGLGFAFGLWCVLGILLLKKSWAIAYFQLFHNIIDNIYVFVVLKVNQWFNQ